MIAGLLAALVLASSASTLSAAERGRVLFEDDFESGVERWIASDPDDVSAVDSGDPAHGRVLQLSPAVGFVAGVARRALGLPLAELTYALIPGSEHWGPYRLEGELFFPTRADSYLGVVCHHAGHRDDFGSAYVISKQSESYIRVNPFYDGNPARALYEELRVDLEPLPRRWIPFAAEVVGRSLHFYVGDMEMPRLTFALLERRRGRAGLKPRIIGGPVWVDDVRVRAIEAHRYTGPPLPRAPASVEGIVTEWEALGPFDTARPEVERGDPGEAWTAFETDPRGAVLTGRLLGHASGPGTGYFRTRIESARASTLEFSTAVPLTIWVDGRTAEVEGEPLGRLDFRRVAWFDFREGARQWVELAPGRHAVLVRVDADYSGAGFFARLRP
jgi:hypothetical protein